MSDSFQVLVIYGMHPSLTILLTSFITTIRGCFGLALQRISVFSVIGSDKQVVAYSTMDETTPC